MSPLDHIAVVGIVFGSILGIIALSVGVPLYFRAKRDRAVFDSIKLMTEKDQSVAPELIQALTQARHSPQDDLRRGVMFLAVSIAIMVFAFIGRHSLQLFGIAAFPGLIGLAYIGFYLFRDEASKAGRE